MKTFRQLVLVAGLLGIVSMATAQNVYQPDFTRSSLAGFKGGDMALINAVGDIEKATGGRVIDIRYTAVNGEPGYHAVIARNGEVSFMHIQQESRNVVEIDVNSLPAWMLEWRNRSIVKTAEKAPVSLAAAIRTAERSAGDAPAVAAGFSRTASNSDDAVKAYNVLVDKNGDIDRVAVDSADGMVIEDPSALSD